MISPSTSRELFERHTRGLIAKSLASGDPDTELARKPNGVYKVDRIQHAYNGWCAAIQNLEVLVDEIRAEERSKRAEYMLHASSGGNSFVTRLQGILKDSRLRFKDVVPVSRRDLRDLLYHFIRLDNDARERHQ